MSLSSNTELNGYSVKHYLSWYSLAGECRNGIRSGNQILRYYNNTFKVSFKEGKYHKLVEVIQCAHKLLPVKLIYIIPIKNEGCYEEQLINEAYFFCVYKSKPAFKGKVIKITNIYEREFYHNYHYLGETINNNIPHGYAEIGSNLMTYIGHNRNLVLLGPGKFYVHKALQIKANFIGYFLQGSCTLSNKFLKLSFNTNLGVPDEIGVITSKHLKTELLFYFKTNLVEFDDHDEGTQKYVKYKVNEILKDYKNFLNWLQKIYRNRSQTFIFSCINKRNWIEFESLLKSRPQENDRKKKCIQKTVRSFADCKVMTVFDNGDRFEGEVIENQIHGIGKYSYYNGCQYSGEFRFGQKHGFGIMKFPGGEIYKGYWCKDQMDGRGLYCTENSKIFGIWKFNKIFKIIKKITYTTNLTLNI